LLPREFLAKFFELDKAVGGVFSEAVRRRRGREDQYTTYLEDCGLYTEEKFHPVVKAWLKKKVDLDIRQLKFFREEGPDGFRHKSSSCDALRESFGENVLQGSLETWNQDV
jgi:hypothetical protein